MFSLWMENLVIYIIISGLAMNLAPSKEYKKQIGFFCGLIIILIAIEPIKFIFNIEDININRALEEFSICLDEEGFLDKGENYNSYYSLSMGEAIEKELINNNVELKEVRIISGVNNEIIRCEVIVDKEEIRGMESEKNTSEKIKKIINDVYKIEYDNIYILKR